MVSKPDPDSLAYTAHALGPHIDLVSREMLPGIQLLHCLVFEAEGGDSVLVDGFACAAELAAEDPEAYDRLTTTPVRFRYRDGAGTDVSARVPLVRLDVDGSVREVRYSNALLAPLDVPADDMLPTYRALRAFGRILVSGRHELRIRLQPGDVMCFDNYRVLHGRAEFDPNSGPRHLQGCYVDRDDFLSRLRTLEACAPPTAEARRAGNRLPVASCPGGGGGGGPCSVGWRSRWSSARPRSPAGPLVATGRPRARATNSRPGIPTSSSS